jgi:3-deoxy-manno-octulosonate cytidylyltransferase (CMP-KDO synthetase)
MNVTAIIPARYQSSRFPGKPLVEIKGKSMISRVAERVLKVLPHHHVIVATDDQRIYDHVNAMNIRVMMTSNAHVSGTDRCAEAARLAHCGDQDIILNVQGDEPYIHPEQIKELIACFSNEDVQIGTLARVLHQENELKSTNVVKVVRNLEGKALIFSRNVIPYLRNASSEEWNQQHSFLGHIGLYGFRMHTLQKLCTLPESRLEKAESLEQLRWLDHGYSIQVGMSEFPSWAVDSPEDLLKLPEE